MKKKFFKILISFLFFSFFNINSLSANVISEIKINGNDRISDETIKLFSNISLNDEIDRDIINKILNNLYKTNFFEDVKVSFKDKVLLISVVENPIIDEIEYKGIKANKILDVLKQDALIKSRSPYNEIILKKEKLRLQNILKEIGYYESQLEIYTKKLSNNLINLVYEFTLGEKAKIKKISFVGNKIFKDNKLKRVIASSEYKFWKFLSGRKFLNEEIIEFDKRLLTNFYKNNGYYNVQINTTFAKIIEENKFELIFNIDAKNKIFFGDISLKIPDDFDEENFKKINNLFKKIKGEPYSIYLVDKILDEIDLITALEQYQFINSTISENLKGNKLNLEFKITETEKNYVKKINIFGNNITAEHVIRNNLEVDEGDPYNEILVNKSINNLKGLNFFKTVNKEIIDDKKSKTKTINITVEEKPTGEIVAGAGVGTSGSSISFGIKENNFLGNGIELDTNFSISTDSFRGKFAVNNPNFQNTDKSLNTSFEAIETDNLSSNGYKTKKTGISIGTRFEYLDDLFLGFGNSNFYETISTNSTASERQKAQAGNYWDTFVNLDLNYDKRNQKFQTSSGFRSFYSLDLPLISDTNTIKNYYSHSYYFDLFEDNVSSISFYLESANSLNNKDVKLSERIRIPSKRLRGFESGRVGPKDGNDFIGGNYAYSLNFSSSIPQIFQESQNVNFLFFTDIADIWGVDYDSSLDNSKIRSSAGLGLDWYSPIGPMNFSIAHPITKANSDKTESFRFNLGTTF